jgi:hypothetical protein
MVVPDASRSRHVASLKQSCGFSTQVRNGICCPQSYPNYKTVHRRFQAWCCDEILRRLLTDVANELRDRGALDEEEMLHRRDVRDGQMRRLARLIIARTIAGADRRHAYLQPTGLARFRKDGPGLVNNTHFHASHRQSG